MKKPEEALRLYVGKLNHRRREIKVHLEYSTGDLLAVKIRTNGLFANDIDYDELDQSIQEWSHSTMRITAIDTNVGFIDIAVASNRNNYSPGLVIYTLKKIFGEN